MKQVLICGLLISLAFTAKSQVNKHGLPCGGMDILDVGIHIQGYKILDYHGIHYSEISADSLRKGFVIALSDTSHKVKWFLIDYESGKGVSEYPVTGTMATAKNAVFIKNIKPGDQLSIECINIQKDGLTNLSTSFRIIVTN